MSTVFFPFFDFTTPYMVSFRFLGFHHRLQIISHSRISLLTMVPFPFTDFTTITSFTLVYRFFPILRISPLSIIFFPFFPIPEYFSTIMNYFPFPTAIYGYTATYGLVSFDTIYKFFLSFFVPFRYY